jgi:hypothetical protein
MVGDLKQGKQVATHPKRKSDWKVKVSWRAA